ncbi:helix-turn-helix domain-containing protein [Streptomyces sp. NPDC001985]|uniref:helix-turn-helix domain-containing protein n=1 Tax=Streptomyces sp. NPDC001985 TaxID=3154406 RepID=UPI0033190A90
MDHSAREDVLNAVGPRLRALRLSRGLTLGELSAATGVSESTLSRLEGGLRRATLELLLRLSGAYDIPLDDLVGAPRAGDPRIHLRPISRFGVTLVPLSRRPGGTQAFKMIIPARAEPLEPTLRTHEGHEWLYVLSGTLRLVVGERDLTVRADSAVEFDTSVPHWMGSADGRAAELLVLFDVQGVRAHARAGREPRAPRT